MCKTQRVPQAQIILQQIRIEEPPLKKRKLNGWSCEKCTLENPNDASRCGACGFALVKEDSNEPEDGWICEKCTFRNNDCSNRCKICGAEDPEVAAERKEKEETLSSRREQFLSRSQVSVFNYLLLKAQKRSERSRPGFLSKVESLGFGENEVHLLEHYMENSAPLLIHVNLQKVLQFFLKDNKYRSQFETHSSGGRLCLKTRRDWERAMLGSCCETLEDCERVKYGACNLTNDPNGVSKAQAYGESFFQLNENVRCRTSICNMDSGECLRHRNFQIGTLSNCLHVLETLPSNELKWTINAARGREQSSARIAVYREVQLHGDVHFGRDVDRLVVGRQVQKDAVMMKQVQQFCEKYSVELTYQRKVGSLC